jgi:hypothetical protein
MDTLSSIFRFAAAELLCFFINMTFAVSPMSVVRLICLVCTILILISVMTDYGIKSAERDKNKSVGERNKVLAVSAATVTMIPLTSWILLCISAQSGEFVFYGAYKLLNMPFLQYYNLIEPEPSEKALTLGKLLLMLPTAAVPSASMTLSYILAGKRAEGQQ